MGRLYGLLRYGMLSIIIPGVFFFAQSREAFPSDQWSPFNRQQMEFAGLIVSSGDSGDVLIAQMEDDGAEASPEPYQG